MVHAIAGVVSSLLRRASLGFSAKIKSGFSHCDPKLDSLFPSFLQVTRFKFQGINRPAGCSHVEFKIDLDCVLRNDARYKVQCGGWILMKIREPSRNHLVAATMNLLGRFSTCKKQKIIVHVPLQSGPYQFQLSEFAQPQSLNKAIFYGKFPKNHHLPTRNPNI